MEQRKFKVGDVVRCVDSGGWRLKVDEIYTITHTRYENTMVEVDLLPGKGFYSWRFVLHEEEKPNPQAFWDLLNTQLQLRKAAQ